MSTSDLHLPNHHAGFGGFRGLTGVVAALSMTVGRRADSALVSELAGLRPGDVVVDIGCGPGDAARWAVRHGAARVIAVDPAGVMLRVGRLLTLSRRVSFRRGAAESLPVDDGSASVVWAVATTHHWPDLDGALDEVRRVLSPGGRFVAIEKRIHAGAHGLASHGWTDEMAERFASLCAAHGFVDARAEQHAAGRKGDALAVLATAPSATEATGGATAFSD